MLNNNKLTFNIFFLTLVQFSNYLAPILVLPYLTRTLSLEEFGIVVMALSVSAISFIITDFGFVLSAPYWISKNREDKKAVSEHIGAIFIIKFIILLGISFITGLYYQFGTDALASYNGGLIFILLNIFFQAYQPTWFFQGIEKMKLVTATVVTAKIAYLIMIFAFIHHQGQQNTVILCLAISNFLAAGVGITLIYKEGYKILIPDADCVKKTFISSSKFFISRAAVGLYTSASAFIIGVFSGIHQAAIYSSAEKLYQAGQSLTSPVTQALLPHLSKSKDRKILFRFIFYMTPVLAIGCTVCIFFSNEIITLFYGENFSYASEILNYFLVCSVVTFISINLGYPAFSIIDRMDLVNLTVYAASVLYVLFLIFLYFMDAINPINIVRCVLLIEVFVLFLRIFLLYKYYKF